MNMIYAVFISLIFVIIGISKNKLYEYQKVISFAIIMYSIIFRFMLSDGKLAIPADTVGTLINITYFTILIGIITYVFSYARQ